MSSVKAFPFASDKWVASVNVPTDGPQKKTPLALHVCLDNSYSMGNHSKTAQTCFSNLVSLSSSPSSFTVFGTHATTLSATLTSPEQMTSLVMPTQGSTNITAGLSRTFQIIINSETATPGIHHVVIFLSDGGHNSGPKPLDELPNMHKDFQTSCPNLKLSFIPIGVSSGSQTDFAMKVKTTLETIPLANMDPIYFCNDHAGMVAAVQNLHTGLQLNALHGRVINLKCQSCRFVRSLSGPPVHEIEEMVAGKVLLLLEGDSLETITIDGEDLKVNKMEFHETVALDAFATVMTSLRQKKIAAHTSLPQELVEVEKWIDDLRNTVAKLSCTDEETDTSFKKLTPGQRLRLHKKLVGGISNMQGLQNQLAALKAKQSDNSADQAAFLTGAKGKFAGKALRRAGQSGQGVEGVTIEALQSDIQKLGPKLKNALRQDLLLLLERVDRDAILQEVKKAGLNVDLVTQMLDSGDALFAEDAALPPEMNDLLDNKLFPVLNKLINCPESFLSLQSQWHQLSEWVSVSEAQDVSTLSFGSEFELLMYLGMNALPVSVARWDATQVDPFQCAIKKCTLAPVDTSSLYCALQSGHEIQSPEGMEIKDAIPLIDPDCPHASHVLYWSRLVDTIVSVILTRDLYMYNTPAQRVSLHAHALGACIKEKVVTEAYIKQALRIIYSIRKHWGRKCYDSEAQYPTLLRHWYDEWKPLADVDISHPYQCLLAMSALDPDVVKKEVLPEVVVPSIPGTLGTATTTALVIMPPVEHWDAINKIRSKHDKGHPRWPPHITLFFPCVPEDHFGQCQGEVWKSIRAIKPFKVKLSQFGYFDNNYIWLDPEDEDGELNKLHGKLCEALPMCTGKKAFRPHMTVGQFLGPEIPDYIKTFNTSWSQVEFPVSEIHMITRRSADDPFHLVHSIPLGDTKSTQPPTFPSPSGSFPVMITTPVEQTVTNPEDDMDEILVDDPTQEPKKVKDPSTPTSSSSNGAVPVVPMLELCNDILARAAKSILRGRLGRTDHATERKEGKKFMSKLLGINAENSPTPKPVLEAEPPRAELEAECDRNCTVHKEVWDYETFVKDNLQPVIGYILFAANVQRAVKKRGGWELLVQDMEMDNYNDIITQLTQVMKEIPENPLDVLGIAKGDQDRVMLTMTVQAFTHHMMADRHDLDDVRDKETFEKQIVSLHMAFYDEACGAKMAAWRDQRGSVTAAAAAQADPASFAAMLGFHAHGLCGSEFWGIAMVAKHDPVKKQVFLDKCNGTVQLGHKWLML